MDFEALGGSPVPLVRSFKKVRDISRSRNLDGKVKPKKNHVQRTLTVNKTLKFGCLLKQTRSTVKMRDSKMIRASIMIMH